MFEKLTVDSVVGGGYHDSQRKPIVVGVAAGRDGIKNNKQTTTPEGAWPLLAAGSIDPFAADLYWIHS